MEGSNRPKNHHWIPAPHLAQWSDHPESRREARVPVTDKPTGRSRGQPKADALAIERDLYSVRTGDMSSPNWHADLDNLLQDFMSHLPNNDVETYKVQEESLGLQAHGLGVWPLAERLAVLLEACLLHELGLRPEEAASRIVRASRHYSAIKLNPDLR